MLVMPADHVVHGRAGVTKAVRAAVRTASTTDCLVTVGLKPSFPSTGLGYIQAPGRVTAGAIRVRRFVEKPDLSTARRFMRAGGYYWNLAWFSWRLDVFVRELGLHAPRHLTGLRKVMTARGSGDEEAAAAVYNRLRAGGGGTLRGRGGGAGPPPAPPAGASPSALGGWGRRSASTT